MEHPPTSDKTKLQNSHCSPDPSSKTILPLKIQGTCEENPTLPLTFKLPPCFNSRSIDMRRVVLPHATGPTTAISSPFFTVKFRPENTYFLMIFSTQHAFSISDLTPHKLFVVTLDR